MLKKRTIDLKLPEPEKRDTILYVRVSEKNKDFVEALADRSELSLSAMMNILLNRVREKYAPDVS